MSCAVLQAPGQVLFDLLIARCEGYRGTTKADFDRLAWATPAGPVRWHAGRWYLDGQQMDPLSLASVLAMPDTWHARQYDPDLETLADALQQDVIRKRRWQP